MPHMQILSTHFGSKECTKEQQGAFVAESEVLVCQERVPALQPLPCLPDTRLISRELNPSAHAFAISFLVCRSPSYCESIHY